jgi:hypothetical protein
MKLPFDKVLLWFLPYSYLVSICYYWGYWGTFNINAFSYYEISDIVKGVISPISTPLGFLMVVGLMMLISEIVSSKIENFSNTTIVFLSFVVVSAMYTFLQFGLSYFIGEHPDSGDKTYHTVYIGVTALYMFGASRLALKVTKSSDYITIENYKWYFPLIYFACLLPGNAYRTGKDTALRIVHNVEFSYVITRSLVTPKKSFYKYLGKAGGVHILLTLDNSRHIILPLDKLAPLIVENYSILDSLSIKRFRTHAKQLHSSLN